MVRGDSNAVSSKLRDGPRFVYGVCLFCWAYGVKARHAYQLQLIDIINRRISFHNFY
ncbi:MAG: hypothetical protein ACI8W7_002428 [Gammaproteobacteria bacterium]|jgi:hypothetical protein